MKKIIRFLLLLSLTFCLAHPVLAQKHVTIKSGGNSITVVSDTSDTDSAAEAVDSAQYINLDSADNAADDALSHQILRKIFGNNTFLNDILPGMVGVGGVAIALFAVVIVILIFLAPILCIILLIYLITRSGHKNRTSAIPAPPATETVPAKPVMPATPDENKDKAILLIAVGAGLTVLFLIVYTKLGIGIGLFLVCYGIGKYLIARRQEHREYQDPKDDEQNNQDNPQQ